MGLGTVATAAVSIGFAVTGISAKIDKAASKVFGEDMVKFANIAGAGFAMYNGGFSLDSAGEVAAGTVGTEAADALTDVAWAADGAANTAALNEAAGITDGLAGSANSFNLSEVSKMPELGDDGLSMLGKESISEVKGISLTTGQGTGVDPKTVAQTQKVADPAVQTVKAATPTTDGVTAKTPSASAPSATAQTATGDIKAAWDKSTDAVGNVFKKVFADKDGVIDKKLVGASLQAVGGAWSGANANRIKQQQIDEEQRRYRSTPNFRLS